MRDDDGMAGGRPHLGLEAETGELVAHPFGGAPAVLPVVRLRADRGNAQQIEQPATRCVERFIGVLQYRGNRVG